MLKAVIFDMDGVLIDSEPIHSQAAVDALKTFGIDIPLDYTYQFIGNTTLFMCEVLKKDFHLDISVDQLNEANKLAKENLYRKAGYPPIPFTKELIQDLYKHDIKLAIASSSPPDAIEKVTKELGIHSYFDHFISGLNVNHSKPEPDIFQLAAKELGVTVDECMIIEDSKNGVIAANRANIPVIGFVNPHSGNQDLSNACILIEGFDEIDYRFILNTYLHVHNLPVTIAETNRLILRELSVDDANSLYELYQDDAFKIDVMPFSSSVEETKAKLLDYIKHSYQFLGFGLWGVFEKESQTLIGHFGIEYKSYMMEQKNYFAYELCYALKKDYWHSGYASEACRAIITYAFKTLGIHELVAIIASDNLSSIQLAKRLGFSKASNALIQREHTSSNDKHYILYKLLTNSTK